MSSALPTYFLLANTGERPAERILSVAGLNGHRLLSSTLTIIAHIRSCVRIMARATPVLEQAPKEVSQLFTGMTFYFNGRSGDKQT